MPDLPAPSARRLPRARWLDARLLLGILLVLLSVVAGARVVGAADDTVAVWASTRDLGPDVPLGTEDLTARRVHLDAGGEHYLSAHGPSPVGRILLRPIGAGELLPASALTTAGRADLRRVTVSVQRAGGLSRGSVVDVYRLPGPESARDPQPAQLVVERVTVARVEEATRALGAPSNREVVLLLRAAEVRKLLDAQASGRIELVQVPQGGDPASVS